MSAVAVAAAALHPMNVIFELFRLEGVFRSLPWMNRIKVFTQQQIHSKQTFNPR